MPNWRVYPRFLVMGHIFPWFSNKCLGPAYLETIIKFTDINSADLHESSIYQPCRWNSCLLQTTTVRRPIYTSSPPNDRELNYRPKSLFDHVCCLTKGMCWPCRWLQVTCGSALSLKGRSESLSDCSLAYTDKQFAFCEPFQNNLWTVPVQYQLNLWMLFYYRTLMASRFVNDYRGKTGILSITFATREHYSQKLRDIYVTISDAQKLSTLQCRGVQSSRWPLYWLSEKTQHSNNAPTSGEATVSTWILRLYDRQDGRVKKRPGLKRYS
jgi:hypothetical protein